MSVSERVAKTKWCPFARLPDAVGHPPDLSIIVMNRAATAQNVFIGHPGCMCLGSGCMAWVESSVMDVQGEKRGECGLAKGR
jgi:hypothetical protein